MAGNYNLNVAVKTDGQQKIEPQASASTVLAVQPALVVLKQDSGGNLYGSLIGIGEDVAEFGDDAELKFIAFHTSTYKAKICGKDEFAIIYKIGDSKWTTLRGPVVLAGQPGNDLAIDSIEFKGSIELIDRNADESQQQIKVFVTYGIGNKQTWDDELPSTVPEPQLCGPCD